MNQDFIISVIEMECDLVGNITVLLVACDLKFELGSKEVGASVVHPVGDLGADSNPVSNICRPTLSNCLECWFDGCEVNSRITFNSSIESMLNIINSFEVVVINSDRRS